MRQGAVPATVLLIGATGQVGLFALPELLAHSHAVLALSRRAARIPREQGELLPATVRWIHPDALQDVATDHAVGLLLDEVGLVPPTVRRIHPDVVQGAATDQATARAAAGTGALLDEVGVLLSCGPVGLAAQWAPRCPGLQRVVCLSTSSVHTKQASPDARERQLIGQICQAEDQLKRYCAEHGIALALLRPTLIYGCGLDQNISRLARLIRRFHFLPVAGKAAGRRQPVHAQDLAQLAVRLAGSEEALSLESAVGGGSVLSYRAMVQGIFTALGIEPRILQVPPWLLAFIVRFVAWLPFLRGVNPGFVLRQNCDQVFDDSHLRELTGFEPRPFAPTAGDFEIPVSAS